MKQDAKNKKVLKQIERNSNDNRSGVYSNIRQNVWLAGKGKGSFYRQNTQRGSGKTQEKGLEESSSFNLQKKEAILLGSSRARVEKPLNDRIASTNSILFKYKNIKINI